MMHKIYTILGATGNVGHQICQDLLKRGVNVRAVGRDAKKLHCLEMKGAIPFQLELTDVEALTEPFQGAHAVFVLLPPRLDLPDYQAYQDEVGTAICKALQEA